MELNKNKKFSSISIASAITLGGMILGFAFIAYSWSEPGFPPRTGSLPAALNEGSVFQTKSGNLILGNNLNTVGSANAVFRVGKSSTPDRLGLVGIGITNPLERLHVAGTVSLRELSSSFRGNIVPVPNGPGSVSQLLTNDQLATMSYTPETSWLTMQRIDILTTPSQGNCIKIMPQCPLGWIDKGIVVINPNCGQSQAGQAPLAYGGAVRICYQNFQP